MKEKWRIGDLIDLEFFLTQDRNAEEEAGPESLVPRDRQIYLEEIEPLLQAENQAPNHAGTFIIKKWLNRRREQEELLLPGQIFDSAYALLLFILLPAGFFGGWGLTFSFLSYSGEEPLNVSIYLWLFVFLQIFLIGVTLLFLMARSTLPFGNLPPLASWTGSLVAKAALAARNRAMASLTAKRRECMEAAMGVIKGKSTAFASLFPWPVFILSQLVGCAFNIGILAATLLRVATSDLAFGWQSTLVLSAESVERVVSSIAMPWSFFVPVGLAHPSLAQIKGSHIILKDGMANLATPDLVSWWPFLCLAVLFYGLVPRLLLLACARIFKERAFSRLDFGTAPFQRLLFRLQTPVIKTGGENDRSPAHETDIQEKEREIPLNLSAMSGGKEITLLVPEELTEEFFKEVPDEMILKHAGSAHIRTIPFDMDEDPETLAIALSDQPHIVLIQEAWQPPIRQTLLFISELKEITGPYSSIHILLIGKPSDNKMLTLPVKEDEMIWRNKINTLGDPGITTGRFA